MRSSDSSTLTFGGRCGEHELSASTHKIARKDHDHKHSHTHATTTTKLEIMCASLVHHHLLHIATVFSLLLTITTIAALTNMMNHTHIITFSIRTCSPLRHAPVNQSFVSCSTPPVVIAPCCMCSHGALSYSALYTCRRVDGNSQQPCSSLAFLCGRTTIGRVPRPNRRFGRFFFCCRAHHCATCI